jgi:hypothetical protein
MISVRVHDYLDILLGLALVLISFHIRIESQNIVHAVFLVAGLVALGLELLERIFRRSVGEAATRWHMNIEIVLGAAVMVAPTLLGYRSELSSVQYLFHLAVGFFIIFFVGLTNYRAPESIAGPKITLEG